MTYTLISDDAAIRDSDGVLVRFHKESPYYQEYLDWIAEGNTPSAPDDEPQRAAGIRVKRNSLLIESDWTQVPDAPITNQDEWRTYRQALRDVTSQLGFPNQVDWPTAPTTTF